MSQSLPYPTTPSLAALIERSPAVVATWRNAPGWPLNFIGENVRQFGYQSTDFLSG